MAHILYVLDSTFVEVKHIPTFSQNLRLFSILVCVSYNRRSSFRSPNQSALQLRAWQSLPVSGSISCGHIVRGGFRSGDL